MQLSGTLIWKIFVAIWFAIVLLSYWSHHPQYSVALMRLPNASILFTLLALSGGAWFWVDRQKPVIRGWMIYAFVLLLGGITFSIYGSTHNLFDGSGLIHLGYFLGYLLYLHGAVLLVWLAHFGLGSWVFRSQREHYKYGSFALISLAIGFSITAPVLLILGMSGVLKGWVLWLLFGGLLAWRHQVIIDILRRLFVAQINLKKGSRFSLIPLFLLFIGAAIQVVITVKPWPVGFDGALLYANTAHLLATYNALPQVGQAFNWELLMSLGELMFGRMAVSILLSHSAIYLCLFALYRLARLFLSKEGSFIAVALLFLTPAFAFHGLFDEKVDLGFLFVVLSLLLLLLGRDSVKNLKKVAASTPAQSQSASADLFAWGAAGWLAGYSFGIKYTALFTIIGLLVYLVYKNMGTRAGLGAILSALGSLFLLGVHNFGYLNLDGTPAWIFAACGLVPGIALIGMSAIRSCGDLARVLRNASLFILLAIAAFSPWMVKHYQQNKELSISSLVQGNLTPPTLVPISVVRETLDPRVLPERKLLQTFAALGITLDPTQINQVRALLNAFQFDSDNPVELQKNLIAARNRTMAEILNPEQRSKIQASMEEMGLVMDADVSDIEGPMDKIIQTLRRRSIDLDEGQKEQVRDLLYQFDLQGRQLRGSREDIVNLRETIFTRVLTEEQYARMQGIYSGELSISEEGTVYRSPLFGGIQREEIRRYLGYERGLPKYLSVPYDMTMNVNVPFSRYLDISFLMLLLLFLLLMSGRMRRDIPLMAGALVIWVISVYSLYALTGKPDASTITEVLLAKTGNHEGWLSSLVLPVFEVLQKACIRVGLSLHGTYQWLIALPFIAVFLSMLAMGAGVFFLFRTRLSGMPLPLKGLLAFGFAFGTLWFFLGNAIVWYGFAFFALLILLFAYFYEHADELAPLEGVKFARQMWRGAVVLSLVFSLSQFFVSGMQDQKNAQFIFQGNFLKHASSSQTLEQTRAQFMPYMDDVVRVLNANPADKVYRVGTFFNYHIEGNDRRVLEDNQLGLYDQIVRKLDAPQDFIRLLRLSGFKYILYDLNTGSIDNTPEQTLKKKAISFFNLIIASPDLAPLYTDNFIRDPNVATTKVDGFTMPGVPGIGDNVTRRGTFLLYEIK